VQEPPAHLSGDGDRVTVALVAAARRELRKAWCKVADSARARERSWRRQTRSLA